MLQLPKKFSDWFTSYGWQIHPHQKDLLDRSQGPATLLITPTGGGKTLAGFLPTLTELAENPVDGLHTLYVSPLKALAADIKRNLKTPIAEMALPIRVEDRTGDTSASQKRRQRADPPHILLTTPESLALMLSYENAPQIFSSLQRVVIDEIHALAESKRGDQLMLGLSRLQALAPNMRRVGLSATVEDPPAIGRFLACNPNPCEIIIAKVKTEPDIQILHTDTPPPWAGAGASYSAPEVLKLVKSAKTTLIFINTRAQAELYFQAIWDANDDKLPIALHHGSLSRKARDKVEAAMVTGALRAVVCTGTLDLGIDWGDVDLVVQVGAPKNIKRLVQRIGRSNHRYNAPSRAVIVPANRFEILESQAALEAVKENDLDGEPRSKGPQDVLCQHILICACAGPFDAETLYEEVIQAGPFHTLTRTEFDACLDFCATGGYALRAYVQWQRLLQNPSGLWQLRDPRATRTIRMNIGTIMDTEKLKVKWRGRGGAPLGEIEESFAATLTPGDTFLIGGQVVKYENIREMTVQVTKGRKKPKIATFMGTKFATSTLLSTRIIDILNAGDWSTLPDHTRDWLDTQNRISAMPKPGRMLVESYWRDTMAYTCFYGFAGRNALQTLGLLLTRRMEEAGLNPIGFVATDFAVLIWGLEEINEPSTLLSPNDLRNGLDGWLKGNAVMKRSFRSVASIAGLIEKNLPGIRKTGRQATFSSDILYDTLLKYDPNHLLMQITRDEAMGGLVDFGRIEEMLARIQGRIDHIKAPHVTPLSAPMLLEVGRVPIKGVAFEQAAAKQAAALMREAGL